MREFKIKDNLIYCDLSLNNNVISNQVNTGGIQMQMENEQIIQIFNNLNKNKKYIIDCSNIKKISMTNENFKEILLYENIALYFNKNFIEEQRNTDFFDNVCIITDNNGYLIYKKDFFEEYPKKNIKNNNIIKTIHTYIYVKFFVESAIKLGYNFDSNNLKYLESSNVYVNFYINIKSLFLNPDYMYLIINDLVKKIKDEFNLSDVYLVGVNNNGIILSRLLAYKLNLKVKSINHLGPKYCLSKTSDFIDDFKNKKFILITDVICLGGEYRLTKAILNILNSNLLGTVCIFKIKDIYRNNYNTNDKIISLIDDINDYEIDGNKINYEIYIDKEN